MWLVKNLNFYSICFLFLFVCPLCAKELDLIVINDSNKHDIVVRVQRRRFAGYEQDGIKKHEYAQEEQEVEVGGICFFENIYYRGVSFWKKRMGGIHNIIPSTFDVDFGDVQKGARSTIVLRISRDYQKNYAAIKFIPPSHEDTQDLNILRDDLSKISQIKGRIEYNGYKILGAPNSQFSISRHLKYLDEFSRKHEELLCRALTFRALKSILGQVMSDINVHVREDNIKNFIEEESVKKNFLHAIIINDYDEHDVTVRIRKFDYKSMSSDSKIEDLPLREPAKDQNIESGELAVFKEIDVNGVSFWKKRALSLEKFLSEVPVDFGKLKQEAGILFLRVGDRYTDGYKVVKIIAENYSTARLIEKLSEALGIMSCIKGKINFNGYKVLGQQGAQKSIAIDLQFLSDFNEKIKVLKNQIKFTRLRNNLYKKSRQIKDEYDQWLDPQKKYERKQDIMFKLKKN